MKLGSTSILFLFICLNLYSQPKHFKQYTYYPVKDPLVKQKIEQWQDLKFGLLMHWGTYSQWGIVESWSLCPEDYGWCKRTKGENPGNYFEYKKEYENLIKTFNPVKFNPEKWADAAKQAGMKYVVFTTKHHDGFCMWDTKETDFKITSLKCPFHLNKNSDITKNILNQFRARGLWAGIYFSKPDWHSPYYWDPCFPPLDRNVNYDPEIYPEKWEKFVKFTHNQIMELLSDYGKIDILWLDGGWVAKQDDKAINEFYRRSIADSKSGFLKHRIVSQDIRMHELAEKARKKQPGIIIVDRAVTGPNQNYLTPENRIPDEPIPFPWESCIISGGGWSYTPNAKYKSAQEILHILIDIVSKGGNLLLNIAPGPDGTWQKQAYERLEQIGAWMKINKQAIYKTRPVPPYKEGRLRFTQNRFTKAVYAIYLAENDTMPDKIVLKSFTPRKDSGVELLGFGKVKWQKSGTGIIITIPEKIAENPPCRYAWVFRFEV